MASKSVVNWLREENPSSIRYRTLTELLGRGANDAEVREARARIPHVGWAADVLAPETDLAASSWRQSRPSVVPVERRNQPPWPG